MRVGLAVASCGFFLLAGCSGGAFNQAVQTQASAGVAGARLTGTVHGGQQAIAGAQVYLLAANTTGYGGAGIAASTSNASLSLLTSGTGRTLDSSGGATNGDYFVTTGSDGSFSITGDYTCTTGQQVYLYALGGNPGPGTNSAAGLMAVLGNCPAAGNFASATPYVVVNEVSTVAAAYAMAGFATDATHVGSSGTALALTGIANAFANAGNLVNLSTGVALATTPAGNGTVPQAEINTLGNILASCVNSNGAVTGGASPTACYTLFTNALSGGSTGTQPGDTATAAINMAHNPAVNVASLYGLSTASPPFGGGLTSQPGDFSVMLMFTGGGINGYGGLAIDGSGNVWVADANAVTELSSNGTFLSGSSGYSGGGLGGESLYPAIDPFGNVWIIDAANETSPAVTKMSSTGVALSGASGYGGLGSTPLGLAIDGQDNVWISNGGDNTVTKLSNSGTVLSGAGGYSNGGVSFPFHLAVDGSGNVWVANYSSYDSVSKISSSGVLLSPSTGYTGGGLSYPGSIAIDSAGNVWLTNQYPSSSTSGVSKLSNSGVALSGNGYTGGSLDAPQGIAIDGAGSAWVSNQGDVVQLSASGAAVSGSQGLNAEKGECGIGEIAVDASGDVWASGISLNFQPAICVILGAAAPVITPIAAGLPATPTANGTSNLGTRP